LHASSCFDLDFTLSALADKGLAALKEEPRTLGFAVGVASRIRARLRRIAQGAFGLAGSVLPVRHIWTPPHCQAQRDPANK
jgi:hypothetical protein